MSRKGVPNPTPEQRRMREIVNRMKKYVTTYDTQLHYEDYSDETFIIDMLYGIGIAIDPEEYRYATGLQKFRDKLHIEYGEKRTWQALKE